MIIPFAAGGPTDVLARAISVKLSERLGQPVLNDNRAGAGGNIAAESAARATPDGYTLMLGTAGILTANPHLSKVRFDSQKDFAPIGLTAGLSSIMVVHPSLNVKTVKELIALAKSKPDALSYGSSGNGSASHLAMERFNREVGVNIQHIPYKGAAPAVNDLLSGTVQVMLIGLPTIMPHVTSGRVIPLGVSSLKASPLAPGVMPLADAMGVPSFEVNNWIGLVAPAGTPKAIITKLNAEVMGILRNPEVRDQLLKGGFEPLTSTPEQFASQIDIELSVWRKVIKDAGIKID
jgi:tripartite-type tricarboxylate transporter receptor subunit TctC